RNSGGNIPVISASAMWRRRSTRASRPPNRSGTACSTSSRGTGGPGAVSSTPVRYSAMNLRTAPTCIPWTNESDSIMPTTLFFVALLFATAEPRSDGGSRLELFVDDQMIESMHGVEFRQHEPRSAGPVLVFDKPWEGNSSGYGTIFRDGSR